jgi:hypothetical protein
MRAMYRAFGAALIGSGLVTSGVEAQDAPAPVAEGHAVEVEAAEPSWTDDLTIGAYVDSYMALRSDNNNKPLAPIPGVGSPADYPHGAYVSADGFGLASAGADVAYSGEQFGATLSLRFGPAVNRFYFGNTSDLGINNITQAYATWKPLAGLTLDLGQFYTLYGAEVFESWRNMNYSRGGLHYLMQPFWHTGLRANYVITDMIAVNAMVVNGTNIAFENNKSPTIGVQGVITPMDELFVSFGYMGAINPNDDGEKISLFDNFFDLVATVTVGDFKVVNNFDFNLYKNAAGKSENWWGISVAPGYSFTNWFGAAARVEYLADSANALFGMSTTQAGWLTHAGDPSMGPSLAKDASLVTLTGTLDFKPVPNSSALVLRPEFRYERSSDLYFADNDNKGSENFWVLSVGAVVTSL